MKKLRYRLEKEIRNTLSYLFCYTSSYELAGKYYKYHHHTPSCTYWLITERNGHREAIEIIHGALKIQELRWMEEDLGYLVYLLLKTRYEKVGTEI